MKGDWFVIENLNGAEVVDVAIRASAIVLVGCPYPEGRRRVRAAFVNGMPGLKVIIPDTPENNKKLLAAGIPVTEERRIQFPEGMPGSGDVGVVLK